MKLKVDFKNTVGKIKPMNAVNNGPVYTDNGDQNLTNLPDFREANIPFARTHDSSICYDYGGEHTVDIHNIFTDFDADPYSPESYDFTLTDIYLGTIMRAGAKVFYRLGSKIEHWPKHYGIMPPKDYQKWAVVCEHIIMHMNEGWADGYHMGIEYWEIWNEPDFNDKCWTGTPEEFYDFFATAAKYLKARFPSLKIGGPAVCGYNEKWLDAFFEKMREENVPMDFYSWHCYGSKVSDFTSDARRHRAMLDRILTEYPQLEAVQLQFNYVDYDDPAVQSRRCYEVCRKHGKPVIVMEPVKGGNLADLPEDAAAVLDALHGGSSASYAIRFAAGFPGIRMVLSGMSDLRQVEDNIAFMRDFKPLDETELAAVKRVQEIFRSKSLIPCTACRYCTAGCPQHISIPDLFAVMNAKQIHRDWNADYYYSEVYTKNGGRASDCIRCGKCEKVCPQHLHIRDLLADVAAEFEKKG